MNRTIAIQRLFSGFDRVEVDRDTRSSASLVRITLFDETVDAIRFRTLHLSSHNSENALKHKAGAMRFYGRRGSRRFA